MNTLGRHRGADGEYPGQHGRGDRRERRHPPRHRLGVRQLARTQRRADQRLSRDRQRIQHQRKEIPQLQHHLVGGHRSRAEPGGDGARRHEAGLERHRPQQQVAAHHQLGPQHRRLDPQWHPFSQQCPAEQQRGQPLTDQVGDRGSGQAQPRHAEPAVDQQRTQQRRHREPRHDIAQRPHGVLHPPHPAVAGQRHQDRRGGQYRDPQPRQRGSRRCPRPPISTGDHRHQRDGRRLHHDHDQRAQAQRQPGGLHAFADGRRTVGGAVVARRACCRAVGQKGQLRADKAEDEATDGQPRQAQRAQPSDDRDVEEQVDRFGGQHPERRQRQPGDAPAGSRGDGQIAFRFSQGAACQGLQPRRRRRTPSPNSRRPADDRRHRKRSRPRRGQTTWPASTPTSAAARSP